MSIGLTKPDTFDELTYFIDKMPDESAVFLMLHSIVTNESEGKRFGVWSWEIDKLIQLCDWICSNDYIEVLTTKAWLES